MPLRSSLGKVMLVASGTALATLFGVGPLMNSLADSSLSLPAHAWTDIERKRNQREAQPFRDELLIELASLFAVFEVDPQRMKVSFIAGGDDSQAASAGTQRLPFGQAYLLLSEGIGLNYALSRVTAADACDIRPRVHPNEASTILTPEQRYALAHELAHITCEHHTKRVTATAAALTAAFAVGPALRRWARASRPVAATATLLSIAPAGAALRWLYRRQEWEADAVAAHKGYACGGEAFWSRQAAMRVPNPGVPYWFRTHPYPHERLAFFTSRCNPDGNNGDTG
ncbi:hypothetical protein PTSG_08246 [Salpingoeca rosetta]|uniref:Peptidase M48 domain-containing protein n=1 Tax=Salpingoeca rosetta (strain ATCC 50818 / BSB-021) TaxID=946362 RepID=F2UIF2_SALR5|nr:uncharacterized protein PTSG_08246 [Salpingoeca rosetta]EGD76901.1 hypothetical protein PTSG_08246 [Salpingoeca rosetta]|eukprot:XP_004991272.1 hypothetical protein PTSG_08246 [Salpingoeca rosetta]